ncbi:quinone oxidoreductase family protein [Mycolicibacterium sediminis]|uniref:quinone oxidoreductase family protein n=1 Tax=Mycolicibacterium sediminis TaxID=1286180 RepID=UPI0013D2A1B5|nr:zinc-binding alcohol dehydrogenase family protein [Mycolicibacterium sediminis]
MLAAVVEEWGATPVYAEFGDPEARDGALAATVEASALTNLTRALISGKHYASKEIPLPAIPGFDGVARLDDGRRVYGYSVAPYGMMAQRTLVAADGLVEVPEGVDSVTAAAVPNPGISAWTALSFAAKVQPGDHVLILGATGVTGAMAAQLAKNVFGAGRVVVAGRDQARLDWLLGAGADEAISMRDEDLAERIRALHAERPFDAVLDYLWGPPAATALTALADSHPSAHYHATRFVQIGSIAGDPIELPAGILRGTGIVLSGVGIGSVPPEVMANARTEALPRLFAMVASGDLRLETATRALSDVEDVWTTAEPSGTRVVLVP